MKTIVLENPEKLGYKAGNEAISCIAQSIQNQGETSIILATGASQFHTLKQLVSAKSINWSKVTVFHLDEYIGIPEDHPASFRKYLRERFLQFVPNVNKFHFIHGDSADPLAECERLNELISKTSISVALVGIGENGHLAFNDPPADFDTDEPYIIANLDEKCRLQQVGEGWFKSLDDVPRQAISMSVKQIMRSERIICSVPDQRKAEAVKNCLTGEVSNLYPASILQRHARCTVYLDIHSASLLG